jgi:pimeloyl-ACP methyl ester carboxylesterase
LSAVTLLSRRIGVGAVLPGEGSLTIAADIFVPANVAPSAPVMFCLPGGAMNRAYFDLRGAGDFSFAAHLAARGFIVVTLDHLGVGDSSRPADGFALTPDILVEANAIAIESIRRDLEQGQITGQPLGAIRSVGVGHSMGAMLTAMQQARFGKHAALVLFGFSTRGLAAALSPEELKFANDPVATRANLVRLAHLRGVDPYPQIVRSAQSKDLFAGETADRRGVEALQRARSQLLLTAGLFSMIPGSCAPECAQVKVPVFLAVGDRDIVGPARQIPADYGASPDISLLVLPSTGHAHFLFDSRRLLFRRVADWCEAVLRES